MCRSSRPRLVSSAWDHRLRIPKSSSYNLKADRDIGDKSYFPTHIVASRPKGKMLANELVPELTYTQCRMQSMTRTRESIPVPFFPAHLRPLTRSWWRTCRRGEREQV